MSRLRRSGSASSARLDGRVVGSKHDVRVEHGEQRVEVTAARRSGKGVDNLVVQHERDPLGGSQGLENHEQRETDRVGQ